MVNAQKDEDILREVEECMANIDINEAIPKQDEIDKMLYTEFYNGTNDDPADAFQLSQNDLRRELLDRGIQPKGFFTDDAKRLQEEFIKEHNENRDRRKEQLIQIFIEKKKEEFLLGKRKEIEGELLEEKGQLLGDPKSEEIARMIEHNYSPCDMWVQCNSVKLRAIIKRLTRNHRVTSLDLSHNVVDALVCRNLANVLAVNNTIQRLELDSTQLGPEGLTKICSALETNTTLEYLGLDNNPLTNRGTKHDGIKCLAQTLRKNKTLRSIHLHNVGLDMAAGKILLDGIEDNRKIVVFDITGNRIGFDEERRLVAALKANRAEMDEENKRKRELRRNRRAREEEIAKLEAARRKKKEEDEWIENQKRLREEARMKKREEDTRKRDEEEKASIAKCREVLERNQKLAEEKAKKAAKRGKGKKK